jgi:hypothetical protein
MRKIISPFAFFLLQFFRLISGWSPDQILRKAAFAFFGVLNGTEYNADFLQEVSSAVKSKGSSVVLYCNIGGTLESTGPSEWGRQSRSLTAAYELVKAGYSNVSFMDGGFYAYAKEKLETES